MSRADRLGLRRLTGAVAIVGLGVVLGGCSSTDAQSPPAPPALAGQLSPVSTGPTVGVSNVPVPIATGTGQAVPAHAAACKDGQVRVTATGSPAAGRFLGTLTFLAVDGVTCSLRGFPSLAVVSRTTGAATGRIADATRTQAGTPETSVTLSRSSYGVARFGWVQNPQGSAPCPKVVGLRVTPPGLHASLEPALQAPAGGQVDSLLCQPPTVAYVTRP